MAGTAINKLSPRFVQMVTDSGRYSDGNGLYLKVVNERKRWTFKCKFGEMGLGGFPEVSLAKARKTVVGLRDDVRRGINPLKARAKAVAPVPTFGEYADVVAERQGATSKNAKHKAQWAMTLGDSYCKAIRGKRLDEITPVMVANMLRPVWTSKAETAKRLRGRIETVFRSAKAEFPALRDMPNPAVWTDNLDVLLGKRKGGERGKQPAVPFEQAADVWAALAAKKPMAGVLALRFVILTACRAGEAVGAQWDEIDLDAKLWTLPARRMKGGQTHVVPLSGAAVAVLADARKLSRRSPWVFPSPNDWHKSISLTALSKNLRDAAPGVVDRDSGREVTTHGWRSTFRDWAGDLTHYQRDVVEAALAHKVHGVEGAYRRTTAPEKRRGLMDDWAKYLGAQA